MRRLIIFGTGEVAHLAWHYFSFDSPYEVVAFTVDRNFIEHHEFCGLPVIPFDEIANRCLASDHAMFIALGCRVFFRCVQPMSSRALAPRRGWGEFVSELVSFATRVGDLAATWSGGEKVVEQVSQAIRKIPGSGGKYVGVS